MFFLANQFVQKPTSRILRDRFTLIELKQTYKLHIYIDFFFIDFRATIYNTLKYYEVWIKKKFLFLLLRKQKLKSDGKTNKIKQKNTNNKALLEVFYIIYMHTNYGYLYHI